MLDQQMHATSKAITHRRKGHACVRGGGASRVRWGPAGDASAAGDALPAAPAVQEAARLLCQPVNVCQQIYSLQTQYTLMSGRVVSDPPCIRLCQLSITNAWLRCG